MLIESAVWASGERDEIDCLIDGQMVRIKAKSGLRYYDHIVASGIEIGEALVNSSAINSERDRRLQKVVFAEKEFDFCDSRGSDGNIAGAATLALAAIIAGAAVGNLRWADPEQDFSWLACDNTKLFMDAQKMLEFGQAAAVWKARHIHAARALKDMQPMPADYANDAWWPS